MKYQKVAERAVISCPAGVDSLEIGVICCRTNGGLTFLWGNVSFFRRINCPEEAFTRRFHDLREFHSDYSIDMQAAGCPEASGINNQRQPCAS